MSENEDLNEYIPSLLHPKQFRKTQNSSILTQNSTVALSLSLKRKRTKRNQIQKVCICDKENINPKGDQHKITKNNGKSRQVLGCIGNTNKENIEDFSQFRYITDCYEKFNDKSEICKVKHDKENLKQRLIDVDHSFVNSVAEDLNATNDNESSLFNFSVQDIESSFGNKDVLSNSQQNICIGQYVDHSTKNLNHKIFTDSSINSKTYRENNDFDEICLHKPHSFLLFTLKNCTNVEISTDSIYLKKVCIRKALDDLLIDCCICENAELSSIESMSIDKASSNSQNNNCTNEIRSTVHVNIELKKEKVEMSPEKDKTSQVNSKILILNTNAIGNISNVIVQPPNFKLIKRQISDTYKSKRTHKTVPGILKKNVKVNRRSDKWKQKTILDYINKQPTDIDISSCSDKTVLLENYILHTENGTLLDNQNSVIEGNGKEMSKNLGLLDLNQINLKTGKSKSRKNEQSSNPKSPILRSEKGQTKQNLKTSSTCASRSPPPKSSIEAVAPNYSSSSPRRSIGSPELSRIKSKSNKVRSSSKSIPYYKIVAGTHFAVDAFSYGEIPHVESYLLTHFHSDHYTGLSKSFSKTVFCSKITAELCVTRLGVNPKCIKIINPDETTIVDGVEITAVDANHCPGAIMLIFTLLSGKTILHTGDFRAIPAMESYPIFWNKDIHTVYLDTTYCSPRYDFPTQDQSLEMALYLLRQKKQDIEKAGRSFSSVLIVCGTYTIGKEKFFLGIARRVGCTVWASSEKATVLEAVEGRPFNALPPNTCQLHALPMKDLTYEKLKSYLESFKGTFSEVVAFKPSGWENGKNSTIEKDKVTIHGIPYSEHSSFSEMVRFIKYLKPKLVVPTVDISGGVKSVQKYFPCPLVYKEDETHQSRVTDYFSIQRPQVPAVT